MTKAMPVLAHRDFGGEGRPPLTILHGLLGSSRNWQTAGRDLVADFHVRALDLRNHGESFHAREMGYATMARDVLEWMDAHGVEQTHLLGHSMGGKIAMWLACAMPQRLEKVVAVDIAPKAYPASHVREFEAVMSFDPASLNSRLEADRQMAKFVDDWGLRQFLLANLERSPGGGFRWVIHLNGIRGALPVLERDFLDANAVYEGDILFLLGGTSRYFVDGDEEAVADHFPRARIVTIEESGHNPHVDAREKFVAEVKRFLNG